MTKLSSITHFGKLLKGQIVLDNGRWFKGTLSGFDDCDIKLTVERRRGARTEKMNHYYFGVIIETVAEKTGYLPQEAHEVLKSKFLRTKLVWRGGEITTVRSTASLTVDEFSEYMMQCIQEAADLGISIPPPDQEFRVKKDFYASKNV